MAKSVHPDVLDGALGIIRTSVTRLVACSAQPTSFTQANGSLKLAEVTMATGDFTLAAGDTNGRKVTVAAKPNVTVATSGTANHVALLDVAGSRLIYVTTCPAQALTAGNQVTFNAWDVEIADPV